MLQKLLFFFLFEAITSRVCLSCGATRAELFHVKIYHKVDKPDVMVPTNILNTHDADSGGM